MGSGAERRQEGGQISFNMRAQIAADKREEGSDNRLDNPVGAKHPWRSQLHS